MRTFTLQDGQTALQFTKLVMGSAMCEHADKQAHYFSLFDKYLALGGDCLDTARCYCYWMQPPVSAEQMIGAYLKARGNRNQVKLISKGAHPSFAHMDLHRMTREAFQSDINTSLQMLGTDHVDLYLLHRDAIAVSVEDIMVWLNELIAQGKTRMIGVSNWTAARVFAANEFAEKNSLAKLCTNQLLFSLATTTSEQCGDNTLVCMDDASYAQYKDKEFPIMAFTAQAKGFFPKYLQGKALNEKINSRFATPFNIGRAERVGELCKQLHASPSAIALAALTCNALQTATVLGASSAAQVEDAMTSEQVNLTPAQLAYLFGGENS